MAAGPVCLDVEAAVVMAHVVNEGAVPMFDPMCLFADMVWIGLVKPLVVLFRAGSLRRIAW
jgi:hypothetical protein